MSSFTIRGSLGSLADLPFSANMLHDAWLVDGSIYVWFGPGPEWINMGSVQGPTGNSGPPGNYTKRTHLVDLTYRGLKVSIWTDQDIASLFSDPADLQPDDLAIFHTTYPEDYERFRKIWAQERAAHLANEELEGWKKNYAKN